MVRYGTWVQWKSFRTCFLSTHHPSCLRAWPCWCVLVRGGPVRFLWRATKMLCCVPFIEQGLVGKSHRGQTRDHNFQQFKFFFNKNYPSISQRATRVKPESLWAPFLYPFILNHHRSDLGPPTPCMWASTKFIPNPKNWAS